MKYFAYGSNICSKRMLERDINFLSKEKGILEGYKFTINKKSFKNPSIGFANIVKDDNSSVEGAIYEIIDSDILKLDRFEGVSNGHYRREVLQINNQDVVVYIANLEWMSDTELKTTNEYKNYILEGKEIFSEEYYKKILEIKTI